MNPKPVLIAGAWRPTENPSGTFQSMNPATSELLPDVYPVSSMADVDAACAAGASAVEALRALPEAPDRIAAFLDDYAVRIEGAADALVEMAAAESALAVTPRLRSVELP